MKVTFNPFASMQESIVGACKDEIFRIAFSYSLYLVFLTRYKFLVYWSCFSRGRAIIFSTLDTLQQNNIARSQTSSVLIPAAITECHAYRIFDSFKLSIIEFLYIIFTLAPFRVFA